MYQFLVLIALDVAGLFLIWLILKARLNKALELESLIESARREVRSLSIELNETADRNISLVEDRLEALRALLDQADKRLGLYRREVEARAAEHEVYTRLGRPRSQARPEAAPGGDPKDAPDSRLNRVYPDAARADPGESRLAEAPVQPNPTNPKGGVSREGQDEAIVWESSQGYPQEAARPLKRPGPRETMPSPLPERGERGAGPEAFEEPVLLQLGSAKASLTIAPKSVIPPRPMREEALELYRKGFSPELIAARLGASIAEIELLISLEEGRGLAGELS